MYVIVWKGIKQKSSKIDNSQGLYLLALDAADAELARVAIGRLRCGALGCLLQLQVLQGARQAECGAVEVARAQRKGQHELVVEHQRRTPCRQVRPAYRQHVLKVMEHVRSVSKSC